MFRVKEQSGGTDKGRAVSRLWRSHGGWEAVADGDKGDNPVVQVVGVGGI